MQAVGPASQKWRPAPTRREQEKWDRATKAATGGTVSYLPLYCIQRIAFESSLALERSLQLVTFFSRTEYSNCFAHWLCNRRLHAVFLLSSRVFSFFRMWCYGNRSVQREIPRFWLLSQGNSTLRYLVAYNGKNPAKMLLRISNSSLSLPSKTLLQLKKKLQYLTLGIGGIGVVSAYISYTPEIAAR